MKNNMKYQLASMIVLLAFVVAVPLAIVGAPDHPQQTMGKIYVPGQDRVQREVLHELRTLPFYTVFDNLEFKVEGDTVELYGQVVQPGVLKSDAEGAVKHIEGVHRVVNNIEVLPLSPFDNRIRMAEYRAIYGSTQLGDLYGIRAVPPIHIIVKNGHVTLVGVVNNKMDKTIAGMQANSVPDVFSVANNLQAEK